MKVIDRYLVLLIVLGPEEAIHGGVDHRRGVDVPVGVGLARPVYLLITARHFEARSFLVGDHVLRDGVAERSRGRRWQGRAASQRTSRRARSVKIVLEVPLTDHSGLGQTTTDEPRRTSPITPEPRVLRGLCGV